MWKRGSVAAVALAASVMVAPPGAMAAGALTQQCTNPEHQFSVRYPSDWYTNPTTEIEGTEGETLAACSLFAPFDDFTVYPKVGNVPIFLKHESGTVPTDGTPVVVDGRQGTLVETEGDGVAWYVYYVQMNAQTRFAGIALDNGSAPFDESKSVLDAMMATIDLDGGPLPDVAMAGPTSPRNPASLVGGVLLLGAATHLLLRMRARSSTVGASRFA